MSFFWWDYEESIRILEYGAVTPYVLSEHYIILRYKMFCRKVNNNFEKKNAFRVKVEGHPIALAFSFPSEVSLGLISVWMVLSILLIISL